MVEADKVNFTIDNWCKLSRNEVFRNYFETVIPLLSSLPIPIEWFRHVVSYDNLFFDYNKLEKYRNLKKRYEIFSLEEILDTEKAEIENTSLFIDPKFPNFKHTGQIPQV